MAKVLFERGPTKSQNEFAGSMPAHRHGANAWFWWDRPENITKSRPKLEHIVWEPHHTCASRRLHKPQSVAGQCFTAVADYAR